MTSCQHGTCPVCRTRLGSGSTDQRTNQQSAVAGSGSASSLSSVAFVGPIGDNESDVVSSILDDVTDTLITGTLPTTDADAGDSHLYYYPAVDDLPLSVSRAPTPIRDLAPNIQLLQTDGILAAVTESRSSPRYYSPRDV
jgi:hypothetical protein